MFFPYRSKGTHFTSSVFVIVNIFMSDCADVFFVNDIFFSESRFMLHVNDSEYPSANHEIHEILKYETLCINLANN
jgi:hypothetical protein